MPDGAGTHEATGEGVTELVIALPHGSSATVQFNPYLVVEHPNIRCGLCVNALWVGLWKCVSPYSWVCANPNPNPNPNHAEGLFERAKTLWEVQSLGLSTKGLHS